MAEADVRSAFQQDGFLVLPGFVERAEIADAVADLRSVFPTPVEFHSDHDPERNLPFRDEFGGIVAFPAASTSLNLLSVHPRLIELARTLLDADDLRCYAMELWAKYTGAVDGERDEEHPDWVASDGRPEWYEHEVRATGPPGTVVVYRTDTFHRGTNLTRPGGHRFTIHQSLRKASADWFTRRAWTNTANRGTAWSDFVAAASPEQLRLFGFPPPGHAYWTDATLAGLAQRYPGFDSTAWR